MAFDTVDVTVDDEWLEPFVEWFSQLSGQAPPAAASPSRRRRSRSRSRSRSRRGRRRRVPVH